MHTHTTRVDLKCILYISHVQPQGFKGVSEFTAPSYIAIISDGFPLQLGHVGLLAMLVIVTLV